jgi:hypothetical protein
MSLTKVTYSMIAGAPANVLDFGADKTGVADSAAAFTAAGSIASRVQVTIPAGVYKLNSDPAPTGYVSWVIQQGASFTGVGRLKTGENVASVMAPADTYKSIESDPSFYNGIFQYLEFHSTWTGYGVTGLHGSTRTGDSANGVGARIGVAAFAVNDYVGGTIAATGLYSTVIRQPTANGSTLGMEIDVSNMGATVPLFPSAPFQSGSTIGIWCATGGEVTEATPPASPLVASVAIGIVQNDSKVVKTAKFEKGILFHNAAIDGTDGATGIGIAVAFATGHAMQWHNNSTQICAEIVAEGRTQALTNTRLNFADSALKYQSRVAGKSLFVVENSATSVNYLGTRPSDTGVSPFIYVEGDDPDLDFFIVPKGTGKLKFGGHTPTADAPIAGYMEVKDSGGVIRKLAVIA